MPSDRARNSYQREQRFRSVIQQQGRVALEADWNEQRALDDADEQAYLTDIIGETGTPDDGFKVGPPAAAKAYDFAVGPGTMYVGGVRAFAPAAIGYFKQPDWLTGPQSVLDFVTGNPVASPTRELVALWLQEAEVSATEAPSLKDVALGGPDTAQRSRLLERIVRFQVTSSDCSEAWKEVLTQLGKTGWTIDDPKTMLLSPVAKLRVDFVSGGAGTDCQPAATGGYLEADNQFIRVTVANVPVPMASPAPRFLWGYDNASFLYSVTQVDTAGLHLTLAQDPPDAFRRPRVGQAVEILLPDATLADGSAAAPAGAVRSVIDYDPDSRIVTLDAPLTGGYLTTKPAIYLRIWEGFSADADLTKPFALGTTGLTVKLDKTPLHTGDAWTFAVRPATRATVMPERYTKAFQPPDEPRIRLCSLAVITWKPSGEIASIVDCRDQFTNLVELTWRKSCCCTVEVGKGVGRYPTIAEALAAAIYKAPPELPIKVCVLPGHHKVAGTINIDRTNVTISGCGEMTQVEVTGGTSANFTAFNATENGFVLEDLWLKRDNAGADPNTAPPLIVFKGAAVGAVENLNIINSVGLSILAAGMASLSVTGNTLSKGEGILVQGNALALNGNTLSDGPRIEVGPPCAVVEISGNEITKAAGLAAIVLQDTLTIPGFDSTGLSRLRTDIVITDNTIVGAAGSGISTRPDNTGKAPIPIINLRISGNVIETCVQQADGQPGQFGGIVLSSAATFEISDNKILRNGEPGKTPVCGIYVGRGRGADIHHNTILGNAPRGGTSSIPGIQGGIFLHRVSPAPPTPASPPVSPLPAATIRNNVVDTPLDLALYTAGVGAIAVSGNSLISRRLLEKPFESFRDIFGAALIIDLGLPSYFLPIMAALGFEMTGRDGRYAEGGNVDISLQDVTGIYATVRGQVHFANNRVVMHLQPEAAFGSPVIAALGILSTDDAHFAGNQTDVTIASKGSDTTLDVDAFVAAATTRAVHNGLTETAFRTSYSMIALGGLMSIMTDNEGTHCMRSFALLNKNIQRPNLVLLNANQCDENAGE